MRDPKLTPAPVAGLARAPRALDDLLRVALAHDPARRPRTALELADRLDGIRAMLESRDEPSRDRRPDASLPWSTRAIVGLGVATFAVFTLTTWLTLRLLG